MQCGLNVTITIYPVIFGIWLQITKKLCYRTLTKHRKTSNRTSDKRLRNTNNNRKIEGINRQDGKGELHLVQDQNVEVQDVEVRANLCLAM